MLQGFLHGTKTGNKNLTVYIFASKHTGAPKENVRAQYVIGVSFYALLNVYLGYVLICDLFGFVT